MTLVISKDILSDGELDSTERIRIENVTKFAISRSRKLNNDGLKWTYCNIIIYNTPETKLLGEYEYIYDHETIHVYQ